MKTILLTAVLLFTITINGQIAFNEDEDAFLTAFVDPTFTDRGEQYGLTLTKESGFAFIELQASHYQALEPSYTDFIVAGGLALNYNNFVFHTGPRLGFNMRENNGPYVIYGFQFRLQHKITSRLYAGVKFWIDYRSDQTKQFYGNGNMIKHNGAFVLSYKLN